MADSDAGFDAPSSTRPDVEPAEAAVDELCRAAAALDADEALDFENLRIARESEGYAFEARGDRRVVSEAELRDVATDHAVVVSNWHFWEVVVGNAGAQRAFLRWLERADEASVDERYAALADARAREWGELLVTVSLADDGTRRYEVRHVADAGKDRTALRRYDDPRDARRLVTFDDDGRYRPLKTAPSLPTGWVFPDLSPRDAYETVETVYPATVANWYREREDRLDVTHWRATAERQTGIYDVVAELGPDAVEWMAEATCVDSQCLKRREWEYDDDRELSVASGEGEFPCREPCSLLVAAARTWTKLERERSREYTFELTPSEKEQVEALVDAVADGEVPDVREADLREDANRYRARYLRAKRFDEQGNLGGVPTDSAERAGGTDEGAEE